MTKEETLFLPHYISHGMIIQQQKPIVFSGKDKVSTLVKVTFDNKTIETITDESGKWSVTFPEKQAGGPFQLHVEGTSTKQIEDILVGEVWLIGGQSNMELPINRTYDEFKEEIDSAHFPEIRQFHIEMDPTFDQPKNWLEQGEWKAAVQENIQNFSSLGFFYAKELYEQLNVPIGIIHTAVGGTPIEAWMNEATLRELNGYDNELDYWKNSANVKKEIEKDAARNQTWYEDLQSNDKGYLEEPKWFEEEYEPKDWKPITIPVMFKDTDLAEFSGAVWFRKTFDCTEEDLSSEAYRLRLGSLINGDETYLNGVKVGETGYRYPPRKYPINKEQLKVGTNTLVIGLSIDAANGGFIPTFPYQLESKDFSISLEGEWSYKIGYQKDVIEPMLFLHYKPAVLYKGMIHPLKDMSLRGILFYQGESNSGNPEGYSDLMSLMVEDWRRVLSDDLPFYYVQLANYIDPAVGRDELNWAHLRDEQNKARFKIPKSQMVPAYDSGISYELHPHDKKTLGKRLSRISLYNEYRLGKPYQNVELDSIEIQKDSHTVNLYLNGVGGELASTDVKPEFEVKVQDEWVEVSDFQLNSQSISLYFEEWEDMKAVRYAWRNDPRGYVYDSLTQLPLLPFSKLI
ncbi:sialate O-acetylesterase [Alkalibacterium iburiense]|uniref:Sialate O-acetylesterase n=1 Tax=Alkalibacterium iburiense TaxID=290589 RepID=A0ABP3H065_9LACT